MANAFCRTMVDDSRDPGLVIELSSGTATIQGEQVKLPLREFRLLAALAERAGEAVDVPDLMAAVWRQDSEWTSKGELYVLVSKLRRVLNEHDDFGKKIRNRRGFGYTLELERDQVVVVESLRRIEAAAPSLPARSVGSEDASQEDPLEVIAPEPVAAPPEAASAPLADEATRRPPAWRPLAAAALVLALAAGSWSAGFALSRGRTPAPELAPKEEVASEPEAIDRAEQRGSRRRPESNKPKRERRAPGAHSARRGSGNNQRSTSEALEIAAPRTTDRTGGAVPTQVTEQRSAGSAKAPRKPPPPPQLPPAPTHYLYHLVNHQTGDHYVTTSPSAASDHQAMGYEGGPIARVYTYQEDGTKAISTNGGSAFVFITAGPKTEPASSVVPLWYSTDGSGDFFYTTNESEAKRSGWQGSPVGYGRTL